MKKYLTERQRHKDFLLKDGDYQSTKEVFERIAKLIPNNNILAELDQNKNIIYHTAKDILEDIEAIGDGLIDLGLEDKHIVISAENSYRYFITDLSIAGGVGVVTPVDKEADHELLIRLLNKCEADAIICNKYMVDKIKKVMPDCPKLKTIITIDEKLENYPCLDEIMEKGKQLAANGYYHNKKLDLEKTAMLLFTSGTTGANKAVMLTQRNLSANAINCMDVVKADKDEVNTSMSVLPMHHATEINTHIMARVCAGRLTYINDSMRNMMNNIKIFKPYVITIVPMIANGFYKAIWMNAKKAGMDGKLKKGIKLCNLLRKFGIDKTHSLFKDVFAPFGGNLKQIVCGGAMLNPEVVKGFNDLGVHISNGYGITECGPLVSMNADTLKEAYSIGKPAPNLEIKLVNIDENGIGELCVRGASVSKGYYKDEEATKQVFYDDGFFNTGDLVRQDDKGRLFLMGRKKNVIVLENGKNICPEEIETEIQNTIEYGLESVIYMAEFENKNGVKQNGICVGLYIEDENLRKNHEQILNDFRDLNKVLPTHKRIAYINLVDAPYEKTSTKKIKRVTVMDKHNDKNGLIL